MTEKTPDELFDFTIEGLDLTEAEEAIFMSERVEPSPSPAEPGPILCW